LHAKLPWNSDDPITWATTDRLLPHDLAAVSHAISLDLAMGDKVITLANRIAGYLRDRRQCDAAKRLLEWAVAEATEGVPLLGEDRLWEVLNSLSLVLWEQGELAEARGVLERALEYAQSHPYSHQENVTTLLVNISGVLSDQGDLAAALTLLERSLERVMDLVGVGPLPDEE
jgi:tetratricopeptide (TPR) repeat protein